MWLAANPFEPGTLDLGRRPQLPGPPPVEAESKRVPLNPAREKANARPPAPATSEPLFLQVPNSGEHAPEVVQAPPPNGVLADVQLRDRMLDVVDDDEKGQLVLGGRAKPGTPLRLYLDNRVLGDTRADDNGRWVLRPAQTVPPGQYTLRVDELGPDGKVVARIELPFTRAEPSAVAAAGKASVVVQPGNSLWRLARRSYGSGLKFTLIY